jgi:polysaccharide biosynthesis PFTS motif protein
MIWYSTNSVPILKQSENQTRYLPKELSTDCDHHFVWDQYQAEEFAHQGIFKTEVKGSMIFVPRSRQEVRLQSEHKSVVIFDVTPFRPSIGYYSGETCEANLRMIIQACEEASSLLDDPISIWLKPKRKYSNRSDADYITLVKELSKSCRVRLLNPKANLYDVMNLSSAVISVPFTSPAILAREAKLPSVFAAIEDAEWLIPKEHHGLPVIRNQRALANWLVDEIDD